MLAQEARAENLRDGRVPLEEERVTRTADPGSPLVGAVEWLDGATAIVHLEGELDLCTAGEFQRLAEGLLARGAARVILEMSGVEFIDSAGISAVVQLFRRVRDRGVVALAAPTEPVHSFLRIARLEQLVGIYPTVEAALAETEA